MTSFAMFSSCADLTPESIVKMIYDPEKIPDKQHVIENVYSYPWTINNKYYTANIDLCTTDSKTIGDQTFAENVQAMILYFDSNKVTSFEQAKGWLPFLEHIEPEIQILLCDRCTLHTEIPRSEVLSWCLDNSFELVELNPEEDSDEEDEVDFKETTGIKRVIQALHSHTWTNLVLKENPDIHSPYFRQMMAAEKGESDMTQTNTPDETVASGNIVQENTQSSENNDEIRTINSQDNSLESNSKDSSASSSSKSSTSTDKKKTKEKDILGKDEMSLLEALGNDETQDVENFEKLFSQMKLMKEKADGLTFEQRKEYAEKVTISFWKAIGGDEEEINGLSDSD